MEQQKPVTDKPQSEKQYNWELTLPTQRLTIKLYPLSQCAPRKETNQPPEKKQTFTHKENDI